MMTMMGKFPHGKEAHCNGLPGVVVEPLSLEVFEERLGLWSWIGAPPTVNVTGIREPKAKLPRAPRVLSVNQLQHFWPSCCDFKQEPLKYEQKRPRLFCVVGT